MDGFAEERPPRGSQAPEWRNTLRYHPECKTIVADVMDVAALDMASLFGDYFAHHGFEITGWPQHKVNVCFLRKNRGPHLGKAYVAKIGLSGALLEDAVRLGSARLRDDDRPPTSEVISAARWYKDVRNEARIFRTIEDEWKVDAQRFRHRHIVRFHSFKTRHVQLIGVHGLYWAQGVSRADVLNAHDAYQRTTGRRLTAASDDRDPGAGPANDCYEVAILIMERAVGPVTAQGRTFTPSEGQMVPSALAVERGKVCPGSEPQGSRDSDKVDVQEALSHGDVMGCLSSLGLLASNEEVDRGADDGSWGGLIRAFPELAQPERCLQMEAAGVSHTSSEYQSVSQRTKGEKLVAKWAYQMFAAIDVMGRCDLLHSDIKPDNVLLDFGRANESLQARMQETLSPQSATRTVSFATSTTAMCCWRILA